MTKVDGHATIWSGVMFVRFVALVIGLSLAGCLEDMPSPGGETLEHLAAGVFTEEATQDEMAHAAAEAEARGGRLMILESFPAQFHARFPVPAACEDFAVWMSTRTYVAEARPCQPVERTDEPDTAVSDAMRFRL